LHVEVKASVLQHVRFKYACRHCERTALNTPIVTAPMPAQPLPGSVATPSTLALVLANKYVDGTPLYRVADALGRADVSISRGTLGNWVIRSSELHLHRVYDALQQKLRAQPLVHGDETWVQVLKEEGRDAQAKSFMWAYRSGQDCAQPVVLFDYQPGRGQQYPQAFLDGYSGLLMSDGYDAWRTLTGATHLGCMAHARRKFTDALKARKTPGGPPLQALKFFEALYEVERVARQTPPDGETRAEYTLRLRQQHSLPVLAAFRTWLDDQAPKVLPESLTGKAIAYARNQWDYLTSYTSDGLAPIDNNVLERDIRPFVTGRKSWLFSDTVAGARASAVIYSLVLTCRACGVDPYAWLRHALTELPQRAPDADIEDLLPFNCTAQKHQPAENSGLYALVSTKGSISFRLDYRMNGRRETVTLGKFGPADLSLARARELCIDARRAINEGRSPAIEKQRAKRRLMEAKAFGEFGEKWLTAAPMADSTRAMRRSIFERELLPPWRKRLLSEIAPDDLRKHCAAIVERGAPATAIHVRDIVKQIYGFAILHGEKVANPADEVGPSSIAHFIPRDRSLSPAEIRIVLKQLDHIATLPRSG